MKTHLSKFGFIFAFTFAFAFTALVLFQAPAWASSDSGLGLLFVVKGDVQVINVHGKVEKAKVGLPIFESDKIITGPGSSTKLVAKDHNVLVLGENSSLVVEKYALQKDQAKQVTLKLDKGSLRSSLEQKYEGKDDRFQVVSPVAVAGVRGTDFLTEFHPDNNESIICTFKGEVSYQAQAKGKNIGSEASVIAGNFIKHIAGKPILVSPAKPEWVAKKLAAHEVTGDEQKTMIKAIPRENEP